MRFFIFYHALAFFVTTSEVKTYLVFAIVVPFEHGKTFHPSLIFVIRVDHLSDASNVY